MKFELKIGNQNTGAASYFLFQIIKTTNGMDYVDQ